MRRVLLLLAAGVGGLAPLGCSATNRHAARYGDQPPAGSAVVARDATPPPALTPAGHSQPAVARTPARITAFDVNTNCNL